MIVLEDVFKIRLQDNSMAEGRKSNRKRAILAGKIIYNDLSTSVDCLIRNISEEGAKIEIGETMILPARFQFLVPQHGRTYKARIAWRQDNEVGLEFSSEMIGGRDVNCTDDLASRLRELEGENALLRKRVIDLKSQLDRYFETG